MLLPFLVFSLLTAQASPGLTVDDAVNEARIHSPALAKARAAASEASWRKLEALSGNLPKLSASAGHFLDLKYQFLTFNFGGAPTQFPLIYPKTTVSLDAVWTVFDGLSTPMGFAAANLDKEAADLELEREEMRLEGEIRLKFFQALGAQLLASVAEQNLKTLQEHLAKSRELLSRGKSTKFDLLRVEVRLAEAGPEKTAADDNVQTSRHALAVVMGLEADERELAGMLPIPTVPASLDLKTEPAGRSDIHALLDRSDAADKSHYAALGQLIPKVTLAAEKQYYDNVDGSLSIGNNDLYHDAYSVGVFLTWNIFDGGATIARQFEAVRQREQAEQQARAALLNAPHEIDLWHRRLLYNISLYGARLRAIETAEESVRLARLMYAAGTRTGTDVLDAELDLFRARAGVVRAQLDTAEARINLELALGRKI